MVKPMLKRVKGDIVKIKKKDGKSFLSVGVGNEVYMFSKAELAKAKKRATPPWERKK